MKLLLTSGRVGRASPLRAEDCPASDGATGLPRRSLAKAGFTLVEIALSLAIIGFALVAIIGVLPTGLNVQRDNREETIIVHEANYFIDAIRSGARGLDDLTNYVEAITNVVTVYDANNNPNPPVVFGYTYNQCTRDGTLLPPVDVITNGHRIIGLLSTPKFIYQNSRPYLPAQTPIPQGFTSNYIVAYVQAISGAAAEKSPQANPLVKDLAFRYRMICELSSYANWNTNWVDFNASGLSNPELLARSNYWQVARTMQGNLHELRLIFRWPVVAGGKTGNGRQVFRALVGGVLTNEPVGNPSWFLKSGTYEMPL